MGNCEAELLAVVIGKLISSIKVLLPMVALVLPLFTKSLKQLVLLFVPTARTRTSFMNPPLVASAVKIVVTEPVPSIAVFEVIRGPVAPVLPS